MNEPEIKNNSTKSNSSLILIVDDSTEVLDLLSHALKRKNYGIETALNGEEALNILNRKKPQLILLDMKMPVMDGWEFTRQFREKFGRLIPIVVMTAAEDSKLRADEVGADAYLGKPFDLKELYEVVEDTILDEEPNINNGKKEKVERKT